MSQVNFTEKFKKISCLQVFEILFYKFFLFRLQKIWWSKALPSKVDSFFFTQNCYYFAFDVEKYCSLLSKMIVTS